MTDRELLEFAAKAAGLPIEWDGDGYVTAIKFRGHLTNYEAWNPLTDDGDALRLVSKLGLEIDQNHPLDNDEWVMALKNGQMTGACEDVDGNRCASLRRAIVRAAAEIGKAMP